MTPLAYIRGQFVPKDRAALSVLDWGVSGGVAVSEVLRTFHRRLFRWEDHRARLARSLERVGWSCPVSWSELQQIAQQVIQSECALGIAECGLVIFVTPGLNPSYLSGPSMAESGPTLVVHGFPLDRQTIAQRAREGVDLVVPAQRAIPASVLDPSIKSRSRLTWYLADQAARATLPTAQALLTSVEGYITECSNANFCAVIAGRIVTCPLERVLPGVSLQVTRELASALGIPWEFRDYTLSEVLTTAAEAFVTGTVASLLPVRTLQGKRMGGEVPGPVTRRLRHAWNELVGGALEGESS
ncbi:MAG: branched chain amino acid aminotransferase [Planctomycetaceae bacterium]|nr:MAG: branched chain amino acid aminotransferase [Planctomycetaceae bacterium]